MQKIMDAFSEQSLAEERKNYANFQQDNVGVHTTKNSMHALQNVFDSRRQWQSHSLNLNVCDFVSLEKYQAGSLVK
jgi:hypothetical protein